MRTAKIVIIVQRYLTTKWRHLFSLQVANNYLSIGRTDNTFEGEVIAPTIWSLVKLWRPISVEK